MDAQAGLMDEDGAELSGNSGMGPGLWPRQLADVTIDNKTRRGELTSPFPVAKPSDRDQGIFRPVR